ncbi:DUF7577 domain-containing protein [Halopiger goleimassiliensis]|uniref:DUF7577 domain-containing protein n=1 Tax=Halopiger goleimassiliensis TaxID=1293048 RepID=UPI00067778B9|nr:hypothetical protein [Halopiger goleimassiliensis]
MELWGWLIGYAVLFALLHLVLYYVYVRGNEDDGVSRPSLADPDRGRSHATPGPDRFPRATDDDGDLEAADESHDVDGEAIRCPHCGARNAADQTFTYCWRCVSTLHH